MKSKIVATLLALSSFSAFAVPASFQVTKLQSDRVDGVHKFVLYPRQDGKIQLVVDPSYCPPKSPCVDIASTTETLTPTVISDDRNVDGSLKLQVGQYVLEVGSGFNLDEVIDYTLIETNNKGVQIRYPLTLNVAISIK